LIIEVIHGPNLNLLGTREPGIYGAATLDQINLRLSEEGKNLEIGSLRFFQSNSEGELVTRIQECYHDRVDGILINPGAYGHTSIALRDALLTTRIPFVEVHISNIYAREEFRHKTYLSDIAVGVITGFGANSYVLGLAGLHAVLARAKYFD
jgi:3-dehydroquinate dehydratase, type II